MVLEIAVSTLHVGSSVVLVACLFSWDSNSIWQHSGRKSSPSLGTALFAPHRDRPRKGGLNEGCLTHTCLASCCQQASLPSSKKNKRKKKTANLKVAFWTIHTVQDSEDHPQRYSALMARELAGLDIDIAALSEGHFAEQGFLMEDGAGYTLFWSRKNKDECHLSGVGFMVKSSIARKL